MEPKSFTFRNAFYAVLLVIGGMYMGFKMQNNLRFQPLLNKDANATSEILKLIDNNYVDKIAADSVNQSAIENLLAKLDPHSVYIPPADLKAVDEDMNGSFEGIGIQFYMQKDTLVVTGVIGGGPSEQAGIEINDKFISVNDSVIAGKKTSNESIIKLIRGKAGSKVKINLIRNNKLISNIVVIRNKIPMYSVDASYMIDNTIGYIKINRFSATTYDEFMKGVKKLQTKGMEKLIIDLRDNPGGYLDAATQISDELIAGKKKLVYTKGEHKRSQTYFADKKGVLETQPIAILIDEGSASASEILSGIVQDYDRGTIVGRRSFGKGLVQEQFPLSNGGALRLTVARYYIPSGRSIQKDYSKGVEAYKKDIYNRLETGELEAQDTTVIKDTTIYKTSKGRQVYGGGGITPDVLVPLDTTIYNKDLNEVLYSQLLTEAVNNFVSENKIRLASYKNVAAYGKGFNELQPLLTKLRQLCTRDSISTKAFSKPKDIQQLSLRAKAQIAKNLFGNQAYYPIIQKQDKELAKAIEVLNKK